jgi:hypothetical protein
VAFACQIKLSSARGGSEELEKRVRLLGKLTVAVEFLRTHDDHRLSTMFDHTLRTF